jgi:pilus assembly protein CpaF
VLEEFLAAAVRARKSIVVSGAQGSGKTTFLRALADALDPWGPLAPSRPSTRSSCTNRTGPMSRSGSRQGRDPVSWTNGRRAGAITLEDLFEHMLRFNLNRAQQDDGWAAAGWRPGAKREGAVPAVWRRDPGPLGPA